MRDRIGIQQERDRAYGYGWSGWRVRYTDVKL
jgi:hypothetical protein